MSSDEERTLVLRVTQVLSPNTTVLGIIDYVMDTQNCLLDAAMIFCALRDMSQSELALVEESGSTVLEKGGRPHITFRITTAGTNKLKKTAH